MRFCGSATLLLGMYEHCGAGAERAMEERAGIHHGVARMRVLNISPLLLPE